LRHKVYCICTHTNFYLNSGYHLPNKLAIFNTLVYKAEALCDQGSLHVGLVFLRDTFRQLQGAVLAHHQVGWPAAAENL
jgi:hypothetical protein